MEPTQPSPSNQPICQRFDIGPDLNSLGWGKHAYSILEHALRYHRNQILIIGSALIALSIGVISWDELRMPMHPINASAVSSASPSNWAGWVTNMQSFFSIGTLLVALVVWYGDLCRSWENSRSKLMSVFFFYAGQPAIVCRYVWLADAGDLRAWGQQVAAQAASERFLSFSSDVKAQAPRLVVDSVGRVSQHYAVCFQLTSPPSFLDIEPNTCRYQNFAAMDNSAHSIPMEQVKQIDAVKAWLEH